MRYWWVNQNQTHSFEIRGGYLWSPKFKKNGMAQPFYEFMKEVSPGDIIFSFYDTYIQAIGIAVSNSYTAAKPLEFDKNGAYWDKVGWKVDVDFHVLQSPMKPSAHINILAGLLPERYSPLQLNGNGNQNVYLTHIPLPLAEVLVGLIGTEAHRIISGVRDQDKDMVDIESGINDLENHILSEVSANNGMTETTKKSVILARIGQGLFKKNVMKYEKRCRLTGVDEIRHLRASHCKPWRESTNDERLDGNNGLLLTPNADHLFDRGFLSFSNKGDLLISPTAKTDSLIRMGIPATPINVGRFTPGQEKYLEYHRDCIFLKSKFMF